MEHWLKSSQPTWLSALFEADSGWEWLSEFRSSEIADEMRRLAIEGAFGYPLAPILSEACQSIAQRCVPVALGPSRRDVRFDIEYPAVLIYDPDAPNTPVWALSETLPAAFWFACPASDIESVRRSLDAYHADPLPLTQYPHNTRSFVGTDELLDTWWEDLENHFVIHGASRGLPWGSEYHDDPWSEIGPGTPMLSITVQMRDFLQQRPGRIPRTSFRTRWSNSVVALEDHQPFRVLEASYQPAAQTDVVRRVNDLLKTRYPEDMPVDVLAMHMGLYFETAEVLREYIKTDGPEPGNRPFNLGALAAVAPHVLDYVEELRSYLTSDDIDERASAINTAWQRGADFALYESLMVEKDETMARQLTNLLLFGHVEGLQ